MSVKVPTQLPELRRRSRRGGPDLCTISLEIELVTPILGGGYQTRSLDDVEVIRAATVRGHLRFWWRALFGHKPSLSSVKALYDAEGVLWGRAATDQGEGVERGGRSAVDVRVEVQRDGELDRQPIRLHSSKDGQKTPGAYALWPAKDQAAREGRAAVPTAPRRKAGTRFKLSLFAPKENEVELRNVVRAWLLFGGYGSRTRRGLGSFRVVENAVAWLPKNASREAFKDLFGYDVFTATNRPASDVPWLAGASLQVGNRGSDALNAWVSALDWLNEYRQGTSGGSGDRAREPGGAVQPNRPSISNWPEADKVRLFKNKLRAHPPRHNNNAAWPRAGFGLPILGQFQDKARDGGHMDEPGSFELRWRSPKPKVDGKPDEPDEHDRLASPLIVKAMPLADGNFVPCALWLNRGLPEGAEVGLFREKKVDPQTVAPFGRLVALGDTARFSALVGKKDLREAFLDWLAKQHKTIVVAP
jgi:CRISPR-associated protein Cmr1